MTALPLFRIRSDGRTVTARAMPVATRPRPISVPPPTTTTDVYRAGQWLLAQCYENGWGGTTFEGTAAHQAGPVLERAGLIRHVGESEVEPLVHHWEITSLGQFEWERLHGEDFQK